jgi:hypothetical protein
VLAFQLRFEFWGLNSKLPCYVKQVKDNLRISSSSNDTAARKRIDTKVSPVAILLRQRSPY